MLSGMWMLYALTAALALSVSDMFRKLGSNFGDPFLSNLIFQTGAIMTAVLLWFAFSRKIEYDSLAFTYAFAGGVFISLFTLLFFRALDIGPGLSLVSPIVRIAGLVLVIAIGVLFLKEQLTWQMCFGVLLALGGVYLIFSAK